MSFVIAAPEFVTAAASDLANIGSTINAAVHARPRRQAHEPFEASLPALDYGHTQRLVVSEAGHRHPALGQQ